METKVTVTIDGEDKWKRFDGPTAGGMTSRNKELLEQVVSILSEALEQAEGELSTLVE